MFILVIVVFWVLIVKWLDRREERVSSSAEQDYSEPQKSAEPSEADNENGPE